MSGVFEFTPGDSPLLISVPHDGRRIPKDILGRMNGVGRSVPDTDWDVARLYGFAAELGASMLVANYSRYVIDLNRSADDGCLYPGQVTTGLCPLQSFAGEDLYHSGGVSDDEVSERIATFWSPYHDKLHATIVSLQHKFGYALLWDAHSIPSEVPRLFAGELPELNLGTNDGASCNGEIAAAVAVIAEQSEYSSVCNGRFKGGYITRNYGDPQNNVHAVQLEIAQRAYMAESPPTFDEARANRLRATLRRMLQTYKDAAIR